MSSVMVEDCDSSDDEHQQAEVDSPISLGTVVGASDAPSLPTKDLNAGAAEDESGKKTEEAQTVPVESPTLKLESTATFNEDAVSADIVGFGDPSSSTAPDLVIKEKAVNIPTDPFSFPEAGTVSIPTTEVALLFFDSPLAAPAGGMCESNTHTSIMVDEQNTGDHSKDAFNLMEETVIDLIPQQSVLEEEEKGTNHSENTATGDGHSEASDEGKSEAAVCKDEAVVLEGGEEGEIPSSIIEESDSEAIEDAQLIASPATSALHAESVPVFMNIASLVENETTANAAGAAAGAAADGAAADGAAADFDDPFATLESENHGGVGFPSVASNIATPFDLLDVSLPPHARDAGPVREGGEEGKGEEGVKSRSRVEESTVLDPFGMIDAVEDDPQKYGEKEGEINEKEERGNAIKEKTESVSRDGGDDIHDVIEYRAEGVEEKQEEKQIEKEEENATLFSVAISASSRAVSDTDDFDFEGAKNTTIQADVCIDRSVTEQGEEGAGGRDIEGEKDTGKEVEVAREEVEEVVPQESMDVGNGADGTESAREIKNALEEAAVWEGEEEKREEEEHTTDGAAARPAEVEYFQAPTAGEQQHQQLQENKETVEQKNEEEEEEEEDWDDFAGPTSFVSAPDPSAVPVAAPVADTLPTTTVTTATAASVIGSGELREVEQASGVIAGNIIPQQQGTQEEEKKKLEGEVDDFGFEDEEDFQGWESSIPATAATATICAAGTAVNATAVPVSEVSASSPTPPAAAQMNAPQQRVMPHGASAESVISSTAFSSVGTSEAGLVRAAYAAREKQLLTSLLNEAVIDMEGASCSEESKSSQQGGPVLEALVADYANFWLQSFDILAPLPSLVPLPLSPAPTGDISLLSEPKPPKIVAVSAETGKISDQVFDLYCAAQAQLLVTLRDHYLPPDALPMTELERAITIRDLQMHKARREPRSQRHSCERDSDGELHDSSISLAEGGESKSAHKAASVGSSSYLKDTVASCGNDGAGATISGTNGADVRGKGARNGNSDGSFHTGAEVALSPAARAFLLSLPDLSFMLAQ